MIYTVTFRRALCSAVAVIISNKGITSRCPPGHARAMSGLLSGGKGRIIAQMIQMRNILFSKGGWRDELSFALIFLFASKVERLCGLLENRCKF